MQNAEKPSFSLEKSIPGATVLLLTEIPNTKQCSDVR